MTDTTITDLGDTHLGRKFTTGVPLERRGDREKMVWNEFVTSLMECDTDWHIQTGDLFDGFAMPEALVLDVALMYRQAAYTNPDTFYVVYRGNHDASRDTNKASSFDVLAELLKDLQNVKVLKEVTILAHGADTIGFIPWHPFKSAQELAVELIELRKKIYGVASKPLTMVYGHWDVQSFGGSTFNLVPTDILNAVTTLVKTGHIHKPDTFTKDGVKVVVVGSMQPYAHGEDPADIWYKTVTLDHLPLVPEGYFHDVNVRVLIKPGEFVPEIPRVLSLITKVVKPGYEEGDDESLEVEFEEFDMGALFRQCLKNNNVGAEVSNLILAEFEELKNV